MSTSESSPPLPTTLNPFVRSLRAISRTFGLETVARSLYHRLTRPAYRPPPSETSRCRVRLSPYCRGYGVDLGFGGDPIVSHAIGVDMPHPYSAVGRRPVQLGGDATRLHWFADNALDFVFSSHLLEDFEEVGPVLAEWLRVLKPGGHLIIYCPDEQVYRRNCAATGQPYNTHHVHADFSLAFVKRELARLGQRHRILHENPLVEEYSWEIVIEKMADNG